MDLSFSLGTLEPALKDALWKAEKERLSERLWKRDHTLWKPEPREITNRLGWLDIASRMKERADFLREFAGELWGAGCTHALLLGMGGSSLAACVLRQTFGVAPGFLDLHVLDSTHPDALRKFLNLLPLPKTAFLVSTKSGGTVETISFFKTFYRHLCRRVGQEKAGWNFICITDQGSDLEALARQHDFRAIFLNDPEIGGRYSALSYFGLVPAGLMGVDVAALLERATGMMKECQSSSPDNPGLLLGTILGLAANHGRDKATFILPHPLATFGDWLEQLLAESTGKEGKGILPVVGEPLRKPAFYGPDRLFIHLQLSPEPAVEAALTELEQAGHPVVRLQLHNLYDLGAQFFLWEMATAVAGHYLGINPFDQPNVEAAKVLARQLVAAFKEKNELPSPEAALAEGEILIYGKSQAATLTQALAEFLAPAAPPAYVGLQAYLPPMAETFEFLQKIRLRITEKTRATATIGYGPRFLHSTGQLHKGDAGKGRFLQFTAEPQNDLPIPDDPYTDVSSLSFGTLILAQALGDGQALCQAGRPVLRLHLGREIKGGLKKVLAALS